MNTKLKRITAVISAVAALSLSACSADPTESFENPRPWQDTASGTAAYEQLEYAVTVYDTTAGTSADKRVPIAEGEMVTVLDETVQTGGTINYTSLDMNFSVTYNNKANEADRGKTDAVTSSTVFQTGSLATGTMTKTVALADRDGADNLSYTVTADYFNERKATRTMNGKTDTLSIPQGTYHDNEMMFYLARACGIGKGTSTIFFMSDIFDCFINGEVSSYTMAASGDSNLENVELGSFIKNHFVPEEDAQEQEDSDDSDTVAVPCYSARIRISDALSGPPYAVYYTESPLTDGGITHGKVPVKIVYAEYYGSTQVRQTEYVLSALSFVKPTE